MSDTNRRYVCTDCGLIHATWFNRCHGCDGLSLAVPAASTPRERSAEPEVQPEPPSLLSRPPSSGPVLRAAPSEPLPSTDYNEPVPLTEVPARSFARDMTNLEPFDAVLGGGLKVGSVVVLGGAPGSSKSSLCGQAIAGTGLRVLYATGEETIEQVAERSRRIGAESVKVLVIRETVLELILEHARRAKVQILVIDSIQTIVCGTARGSAGSPGQIKECASRLVGYAKDNDLTVIIIGHVTNDDALAGPRTLAHIVDVVLLLELGQRFEGNERILRCDGKNRFGATNVTGRFEVTPHGLVPVPRHAIDLDDDGAS